MKNILLTASLFAMLLSGNIYAQSDTTKEDPFKIMRQAHDYSKENGIGIFMLAGQDYEGVTVENINRMFNNSVAKHDIQVKVFVEWSLDREFSLFKAFVYGEGVGEQANIEVFSNYFKEALKILKSKKG